MTSNADNQGLMSVEVIYALPNQQKRIRLQVKSGTTCIEAVTQSNIAALFDEIDLASVKLGIYSRSVKHHQVVKSGERIEIYRPLQADMKAMRVKAQEVRQRRLEETLVFERCNECRRICFECRPKKAALAALAQAS